MITGRLVTRAAELELLEGWDGLAVAAGRPYSAPGWMLAWWEAMRPGDAALRVALAAEEGALLGVAPFFGVRRNGVERLVPLAAPVCAPAEPVAVPGREEEAGAVLADALASSRAHVLAFPAGGEDSPWPRLLGRGGPGRRPALLVHGRPERAPGIVAPGGREAWWASRTASFRRDVRRRRRGLERAGASLRRVDDEAGIAAGAEAFWRLHSARLAGQGGTSLDRRAVGLLRAAARRLARAGRMWLWVAEAAGEPVAVQVCVAAGDTVAFWNSGWDESWRRHQPGLQTLLAAVDDALDRGHARLDLGPGASSYKYRLATGELRLRDVTVPLRLSGRGGLALAAETARTVAAGRLGPERAAAVRSRLRRPAGAPEGRR